MRKSRHYPYKPVKVSCVVEEVTPPTFEARMYLHDREYFVNFPIELWPESKLDLLIQGRYFTFPGKRGPVEIHVIDRPLITRSQIKRARIEARKWMKLFRLPEDSDATTA